MKRSGMKPGKPLKQGSKPLKQSALKQGSKPLKQTPLKQGSKPLKQSVLKQGAASLKQSVLKHGSRPLKQSALKPGEHTLARTPLKPRSVKRQTFMREERVPLIKQLIKAGVGCEVGPVLARQRLEASRLCTGNIEGLHELRKRSSGGSTTKHDNLVPSCNRCNGWIEDNPDVAWMMGLVIRPGDPDWDRLGIFED